MKHLMSLLTIFALLLPMLAEAKGFRSSSSSRSYSSSSRSYSSGSKSSSSSSSSSSRSYSSPSSSSRSYSSSSSSYTGSKGFFTRSSSTSGRSYGRASKSTTSSTPTTINKNIGIAQAKTNSKLALDKFRASKAPQVSTSTYSSYKSNSPVLGKISTNTSPSRLRTYNSRRETMYSSYTPPVYVYNSSPSFGMFDSMFLWYMLDNSRYHSTYYHHQNDPGMKEWRQEAEKQAATNAELKAKLAKLDAQMATMNGTKVDPTYVPEGVDADLMLSEGVVKNLNKELTTMSLATGSRGNNYWELGSKVKSSSDVGVQLISSAGSMANLKSLTDGTVDAAIVQSDAFKVWQKENPNKTFSSEQAPLYKEYVHVLVNRKSGVNHLTDLNESFTVYVPQDSGSEVTWKAFGMENSKYQKVTVKYATLAEALLKVSNDPKAVTLFVSGLNSKYVKTANEFGEKIKLVDLNDDSLLQAKDQFGNTIYESDRIPSETYAKLQDGFITSALRTLSVDAVLVLSESWKKKQGETAVENVTAAFVDALPQFKSKVEAH